MSVDIFEKELGNRGYLRLAHYSHPQRSASHQDATIGYPLCKIDTSTTRDSEKVAFTISGHDCKKIYTIFNQDSSRDRILDAHQPK